MKKLLHIFNPTNKLRKGKKEKKERKYKNTKRYTWRKLRDCLGWWWKTKITSEKVEGLECIRLAKLMTDFWMIKDSFSEN